MLNENLVWEMMQSINDSYTFNHTALLPLESLFLFGVGKLKVGNQVVIEDGKIVTGTNEVPTHEITGLMGTLADNKHSITLRNLTTNEPLKIDL